MSINAPSSSTSVSSASSSAQVNSASNSDNAKKTSTDSSFKEEMNKVSKSEKTSEEKSTDKISEKSEKVTDDKNETSMKDSQQDTQKQDLNANNPQSPLLEGNVDYSNFASLSMANVNSMLSDDIAQMANNVYSLTGVSAKADSTVNELVNTNSVSMTQSDADFFVNLTQQNDVSIQNITVQAQNMINSGADVKEVKQNVQISETLLNAINTAKENNQPLRIDFDQNVSVIMRVSKDGVISANFIPGDKAVEQYLKNNIDNLKATFNEQDLPYSDLSYSNRGKQQQKERRNRQ